MSTDPTFGADGSLRQAVTERTNPATSDVDRMSSIDIVRTMNAEDATVADAVRGELPAIARAIEAIAGRLRAGGRLIYVGAGTSGRLGLLDAVECPPTFNVPPAMIVGCVAGGSVAAFEAFEDVEDDASSGETDIARLDVTADDAVVGISASGSTPYVLGAIDHALPRHALTIGLACNPHSPLAQRVEIMIAPVVGPEVIAGSTRLKAGTAQKMVLNMLSTGTMILLGKTYRNLMVDVRTTNQKLHARAVAIVQQTTGLSEQAAHQLLVSADGEVKTAIVAARTGASPAAARAHLAAHGGDLRTALGE